MLYLITGAGACGKSEYAENTALKLRKEGGGLYYIAAMMPFGEEAGRRILRHRRMREGKGFETVECYTHLERLSAGERDVLLVECMSNLLANEIYDESGGLRDICACGIYNAEQYRDRLRSSIISPVLSLAGRASAVIIVTNDVFADGRHFKGCEEETEVYCRMLGELNIMLAEKADVVVEVLCGTACIVKPRNGDGCV